MAKLKELLETQSSLRTLSEQDPQTVLQTIKNAINELHFAVYKPGADEVYTQLVQALTQLEKAVKILRQGVNDN